MLGACGVVSAAAAPPSTPTLVPGRAVEILAPRFFPTWQTQNVAFPFVMRDGTGYRMFYAGSAASWRNGSAWDQWATGIARSRDTVRWTMPDVYEPVVRPHRFREGEVVGPAQATRFDAMAAYGVSVVREGEQWRMWFTGWSGEDEVDEHGIARPRNHRIGHATSSDGASWTKVDGDAGLGSVFGLGPAGSVDAHGVAQPFVVRDGDGFRMWYEAFDGATWRIATARSPDGIAWTREGVALEPSGEEHGVRNPVVVRRPGGWELWYQALVPGRRPDRVMRATSADGTTWTGAREVVVHPRPGPREGESVHVDSVLVSPDGSAQVFFGIERANRWIGAWGEGTSRSFYVYTEIVAP